MIKLYFTYLASNFIMPYLLSTFFFVSFLVTFELFRIISLVTSDEISFIFILGMLKDVSVTLIPMATPLSIFFSIIYALNKISSDSEYIALRAAGLQKRNILSPYMIISVLVAINVFYLSQQIVPRAHYALRKKIKIVSSTSLIQGIKSGQFFTAIPNITLFTESIDENTKDLKSVFLSIYDPKKQATKTITAKYGKIIHEKDENTGVEKLALLLNEGNMLDLNQEFEDKIFFEEYLLPISEQQFSYSTATKEIMMNRHELKEFIDGGVEQARKNGFSKKTYRNAIYEYWNRINTPILVILLSFLGFSLGVTPTRSEKKNSSAIAIGYLILYYAIFFALVSQSRSGAIPTYLAMLIPNLILLGLGIQKYRKLDWAG